MNLLIKNTASTPHTRQRFNELLKSWYQNNSEDTVGTCGDYGGVAFLWAVHDSNKYYLNADTKRSGVGEYLEMLKRYANNLQWSVVKNQNGTMNKIAFGPEKKKIRGFYLYVDLLDA